MANIQVRTPDNVIELAGKLQECLRKKHGGEWTYVYEKQPNRWEFRMVRTSRTGSPMMKLTGETASELDENIASMLMAVMLAKTML